MEKKWHERITYKNALNDPIRHVVYDVLQEMPDATDTQVAGMTGLGVAEVRYHREKLTKVGRLSVKEQHSSPQTKYLSPYPHYQETLDKVRTTPGITEQEIVEALQVEQDEIQAILDNLYEHGHIIHKIKDGRRYFFYSDISPEDPILADFQDSGEYHSKDTEVDSEESLPENTYLNGRALNEEKELPLSQHILDIIHKKPGIVTSQLRDELDLQTDVLSGHLSSIVRRKGVDTIRLESKTHYFIAGEYEPKERRIIAQTIHPLRQEILEYFTRNDSVNNEFTLVNLFYPTYKYGDVHQQTQALVRYGFLERQGELLVRVKEKIDYWQIVRQKVADKTKEQLYQETKQTEGFGSATE